MLVKLSSRITYFGGITLNTRVYAKTVAGNQHSNAAKRSASPPKPIEAGAPKDKSKPNVTQGILCHHIGMMGAWQKGHSSYGGPELKRRRLRFAPQLGQVDHEVGRLLIGEPGFNVAYIITERVELHRKRPDQLQGPFGYL